MNETKDHMICMEIKADSLGAFSGSFLEQSLASFQEASVDPEIGKVPRKYIAALKRYVECRYLAGYPIKTLQEIAIEHNCSLRKVVFNEYLQDFVLTPFRTLAIGALNADVRSLAEHLSGVVHAINGKTLLERVGECDEKTFHLILDAFGLEEIEYRFESFRDTQLEVLYSNDGVSLNAAPVRSFVNSFFRFFIDGDALKDEDFNPERYYGCIPVSESRVFSYCREQKIPDNLATKLMSIVKCSNRFDQTVEHGETLYSLKVQYLNNKYAMSVAILFKEGKPLHKEVLHSRIQMLHKQYPNLVDEHSLDSFVLRGSSRAKPILCSASVQGEWKLQIWNTQRNVLQDIRDYVTETYNRTSQPVPLEDIITQMSSLGHTYPKRTLQTYITKAGCVGRHGNVYMPQGFEGDKRVWIGKLYEIQRYAAICLLACGRTASRKTIMGYIAEESGNPVNLATLNQALKARSDLFSVTGDNKRNQRIVLSDLISCKRDVNRLIAEPEKKEQDYLKQVRQKMVDYLFIHEEETQKTLTDIFVKDLPDHLKSGDATIRKLLSDEKVFNKIDSEDGRVVSLQPSFRARMELEKPKEERNPEKLQQEIAFSWDKLKDGIMTQLLKNCADPLLPSALDNVFVILRCGEEDLPLNTNFRRVVMPLFKYATGSTSVDERRDLQEKMLGIMEAFLREFYLLKFGDSLQDKQGFGALRFYFQDEGIFPDKNRSYLPPDEMSICRVIDAVNAQRNKVVGHPAALAEQSDKQAILDIRNCLDVMAYLGRKF